MTSLKDAIEDILNHRHLSVEEAADRHFSRGFRQRTNGRWDDRAAFVARITQLREIVDHVHVTVLDELAEGRHYAERHRIELVMRDKPRMVHEVYVFAQRDADGRFARIEEATVALEP